MYSKQYIYIRCYKGFSHMQRLKQHQSKCDSNVDYVYLGGVYESKLSIFDELRSMGITVAEELRVGK